MLPPFKWCFTFAVTMCSSVMIAQHRASPTSVQMCSSAALVITDTLAQHQQMKEPGRAQEGLAAHVVN